MPARPYRLIGLFWIVLLTIAPAGLVSAAPAAPAGLECDRIPGGPELVAAGRVLLLGELHGTAEAPAFVASLSCNVAAAGLDLVVGLELSPSAQSSVDRFLDSEGTPEDRERLVSHALWQRDYQDGRTSRAMVDLIERLGELRRAGGRVSVVLFDASGAGGGQQRDRAMAANLATSVEAHPEAMHIVLSGNVHSRVFPGAMRNPEYEPMGYLLKRSVSPEKLVSLNLGHEDGTAWVCNPGCGVIATGGRAGGTPGSIEIEEATRPAGHDGWYHVGGITASPPASGRFDRAEFDERVARRPVDSARAEKPPVDAPEVAAPVDEAVREKWQGHWQSYQYGSKFWTIDFEEDTFHAVLGPDDWYKGTTEIRPEASPPEIDIHIEECRCSYLGGTSKAVYRWDGDSIILDAPRPGYPRPAVLNERSADVVRLERLSD